MTNLSSSSDANPYAPPSVLETEAPATLAWQVDGTGVLAKNGATLPQVDLDTGVSEGPMRSLRRVGEFNLAIVVASAVFGIGGYFGAKHVFGGEFFGFFCLLLVGQMVFGRLRTLRGAATQRVLVWTFLEESRARRIARRRWLRISAMLVIAISMVVLPLLLVGPHKDLMKWFTRLFAVGIPLLIILIAWAVLDQGKTRIRPGPQGWLRIERVHPEALAKLREIEREIRDKEGSLHAVRKRRVRTSWFHRYPLRLLIGKNWKRPILVINIALMKLLRSKLLERETYHFSEAEEIPVAKLCDALVKFNDDWRFAHPDWIFISARHLPSPAGDLMVDSLFLASPGLEHCASVSHVWLARNHGEGTTETCFFTWVEDGRVVASIDHAPLPLSSPRMIGQRVSGTPEQVFESHRNLCAKHAISASRDRSELLARIRNLMEESDALLTEAGFQSVVRETG